MRINYRWISVLLLSTFAAVAQQPAPGNPSEPVAAKAVPAGIVTGRVYLGDSKTPARKATVYLQPAAALAADTPPNDHGGRGQAEGGISIGDQTRFDGSFSFSHVADGVYYVIASAPGYVLPYIALSLAEGRSLYGSWQPLGPAQQAAKEVVLKSIPRVTVQSGVPAAADVFLERGAAVSGNISYDDGSPASGLPVTLLAQMMQEGKETWTTFQGFGSLPRVEAQTDDRGNYRLSGLPAGKYMAQVTCDLSQQTTYFSVAGGSTHSSGGRYDTIAIYSGSTPRLPKATAFSVELGEEHAGEDIRIPISKLHTIRGNLVSAYDGHVLNGGQVQLLFADDHSLAGSADMSTPEPGFTLNFIYDGDYLLTSPISFDVDYQLLPDASGVPGPPIYNSHPQHLYGSASSPLHVDGDMEGVSLAVPEPTASEAEAGKVMLQTQQ